MNMGQIRAYVPIFATTGNEFNCFVFTSSEYFSPSAWLCMDGDNGARLDTSVPDVFLPADNAETKGAMFDKSAYGSVWNAWVYLEVQATASTYLRAQVPDHAMIVGTRQGTGVVGRMKLETTTDPVLNIDSGTPLTAATANMTTAKATVAATNTDLLYVDPPTNGMAQFKGLTTTANQKLYLQVICLGVAPVYTTWAKSAATGTDALSFIVNCYTGIPQCGVKLTTGYNALNSTHADVS